MTVVAIVVEVVVAGGGVFVDTGVFSVTDDFLSPDDDGLSEKFAFWFLVGKHIHKEVSVNQQGLYKFPTHRRRLSVLLLISVLELNTFYGNSSWDRSSISGIADTLFSQLHMTLGGKQHILHKWSTHRPRRRPCRPSK